MDKQLFLEIIKNSEAEADHADEILALQRQHPYSQLLHALSARLTRDHKHKDEQHSLQMAAVYAADRHVLRDLMSEFPGPQDAESEQTRQEAKPEKIVLVQKESHAASTQNNIDTLDTIEMKDSAVVADMEVSEEVSDHIVKHSAVKTSNNGLDSDSRVSSNDVAETVMSDLRKLHNAKHNFEMMFAGQNDEKGTTTSAPPPPDINSDFTARKRKREQPQETILDEIKIKKEALEPENERQKEQIEIIDHFIKTQPSISNPKERQPAAANDLNSIKPGEFGENIISETLVEILVKQGKKERAIEVLKKLIWKYPQKKAYFASQIEDLRK